MARPVQPWMVSFRERDSYRERSNGNGQHRNGHDVLPSVTSDGQRPCGQGTWCLSPVLTRQDDGTYRRDPGLGYRAFCDRDRNLIAERLEDLPEGYKRLGDEAGELRASGSTLRMPFGPKIPLHEGMEALHREMARTLAGWHARVAGIAKLTPPPPLAVLGADGLRRAVRSATGILAAHIDVLLGLQPGWMTRYVPVPPSADVAAPSVRDWLPSGDLQPPRPRNEPLPEDVTLAYGDAEIVRAGAGYIAVLIEVDGEAAGLEVLGLHRRALRLLGEVRQRPDSLDGVPCKRCDDMALERAEPPSDPALPEMYSRCASCHDEMSPKDYRAWSDWYAGWARGADLTCHRCENGAHDQCEYRGCACPDTGPHPARPRYVAA